MFTKYYLAYGSNLNLEQMYRRCPFAQAVGRTILENYRLAFKGVEDGYAYLTIEKCEGASIPIGIFKITLLDEFRLDVYEGYPSSYHKEKLTVKLGDRDIKGLIYVMNPHFTYHAPSYSYVMRCLVGYEDFGFSKNVLFEALDYTRSVAHPIRKIKNKNK